MMGKMDKTWSKAFFHEKKIQVDSLGFRESKIGGLVSLASFWRLLHHLSHL